MTPIEQRIEYKFRNSLLLAEALTHPSLGYENQRQHFDNQRLEFLGDAVLQLVVTEQLYRLFPDMSEGKLTKMRARIVSKEGLCRQAENIDLGPHILMGRGEESSGGRTRASTLADAFEALVGAIFLDGGLNRARDFVLSEMQADLKDLESEPLDINPKGRLQEELQALSPVIPEYRIIFESGPEHKKVFTAEVAWGGEVLGSGDGKSKKEAETAAALQALRKRKWKRISSDPVAEQAASRPDSSGS